jgi:hypothetical protein
MERRVARRKIGKKHLAFPIAQLNYMNLTLNEL